MSGIMKAGLRVLFGLLFIGTSLVGVLFLAVVGWFWAAMPDLCGNEMLAEYSSPKGTEDGFPDGAVGGVPTTARR